MTSIDSRKLIVDVPFLEERALRQKIKIELKDLSDLVKVAKIYSEPILKFRSGPTSSIAFCVLREDKYFLFRKPRSN